MRAHPWPGNVRELEHWIESAVVLSPDGRISASPWRRGDTGHDGGHPQTPGQLAAVKRAPPEPRAEEASAAVSLPLGLSMDDAVARYAEATIDACEGNKTEAAKKLGIGRNTLARLLRR